MNDTSQTSTRARHAFAAAYTAAWCSQNAASVASFYALDGSITINNGTPSVGRAAITASAQSFMTAFPDLVVEMNRLDDAGDYVMYHWTLIGTNTGPNGTGRSVRVDGYEKWTFDDHGLVAQSIGWFDGADYERQLNGNA